VGARASRSRMVREILKANRRLPTTQGKEARIEYLKTVGTDDIRLLAKLDDPEAPPRSLKQLPEEVEILHRIWEQQYVEIEGGVRVLDPKEMPEAARRVESPYETETRYSTKGAMSWVGYPTVLQWIRKR
jgi:transposase